MHFIPTLSNQTQTISCYTALQDADKCFVFSVDGLYILSVSRNISFVSLKEHFNKQGGKN